MWLRARERDVITNMPVSNHRIVRLNGHVYDVATVMHLCVEKQPKDPILHKPLRQEEANLIRSKCMQIGVVPKKRNTTPDPDAESDGDELRIDAVMDVIQTQICLYGTVQQASLYQLVDILHSIRSRDLDHGVYATGVVLRQLKNTLCRHYADSASFAASDHPVLAYIRSHLHAA